MRGLSAVVPAEAMSLMSWHELESAVCGKPEIDVGLLESTTQYSSCSASDRHIRLFWTALRSFSHEERSLFLRFVWGRSRLPLTAAAFTQRFTLQTFGRTPADSYLPVSHTCFFSLELPAYSSEEVMAEAALRDVQLPGDRRGRDEHRDRQPYARLERGRGRLRRRGGRLGGGCALFPDR